MTVDPDPQDAPAAEHQPLHAVDRRLDEAFAALTSTPPDAFLHCLQGEAGSTEMPSILGERLPDARWIPTSTHALTYVDPTDHLMVHQAWLEACHGPDRVAHATVRTVQPLVTEVESDEPGPIGLYDITLIDLIGTPGIDAVVVTLVPVEASDRPAGVIAPPPRGAASFRLRLDLEGTIIGGTVSTSSLLGRPLSDLVGTAVAPLIHPDDMEPASGTWEDVLAKPDQSQTVRVRLQHADGSWRWFHDTVWNALEDPDTPGILCEFHDIHALVEAEQALHASELSFRTLAESLPVGVTVLDQDGRVHFANHRMVTILIGAGLSGPESESPTPEPAGPGFVTSWTELVSPAFADEVADLLRPRDPSTDAPISRQIEVIRPDGQPVHLLVQAVTIWNQDGRSVIVSAQDVTSEVQLSRAHARMIQVVDEVDDVVVLCRVDDTIAYLNQAARRFLGDDAVGKRMKSFMPDRVREITEGTIEPVLAQATGWNGDLDITDLAGRRHTMDTTVRPVVDPASQELHVGITMRDVTAERAHERVLARQARHDTLTDLPNRFALMELLEAQRDHGEADDDLAVFFIDLDNLKIVNDGLGHSAGDRVLVAVARELQDAAGGETVARFGGDEFVVVCERVGPDDALARAQQFLAAVERAEVSGVSNDVSASIGVATATRGTADAERLIRDADAAMYAAKRAGRSRCALFDDALRNRVSQRFQMEAALRSTIDHDGLTVHFQPIVSLADGSVNAVEALCRWDQGSPADFIPIAEESGLIVRLGEQVLVRSLTGARIMQAAGPAWADLRVGINVSARELDQPDFAQRTLRLVEASGVSPDHVVLELTESVLIDPRDEVDAHLHTLRDAGIVLALDDFGSGYSSLTYLRRYPLDVLKLDISYTQAMVHDLETRVIVETIVTMANRLGLRVVAEGVETMEQLDVVRELGVTSVQGYLLGRPAPLEQLLEAGDPIVDLVNPPG